MNSTHPFFSKGVDKMRVYKIQKMGRSYYIALPKALITDEMLENGVIVYVRRSDEKSIVMEVMEAGAIRKFIEDNTQSGENA